MIKLGNSSIFKVMNGTAQVLKAYIGELMFSLGGRWTILNDYIIQLNSGIGYRNEIIIFEDKLIYFQLVGTKSTHRYNPITNTWDTSLLASPAMEGARTVGDYFFGGYASPAESSSDIWQYIVNDKFGNNTFQYIGAMQYIAGLIGVIQVGFNIYYMGGKYQNSGVNYLYKYNLIDLSHTQLANMPVAKWGFSIHLINGKIYCIGGFTGSYSIDFTNIAYNISTNTWEYKNTVPTFILSKGITLGTKIYFLNTNYIYIYDSLNDSWYKDLPGINGYSVKIGNDIYTYNPGTAKFYKYNPII